MTGLSEFLLARIAEDERHARAAADRIPLIYDADVLREKGLGIAQAGHIARHDPARVLARCKADRLLIEIDGRQAKDKGILAALALPYADHADYQPEWNL